jgi:hypothetical protein
MVQYQAVRGLAALLLAVYWQPPGHPPAGEAARAAFVDATGHLGAKPVDRQASAATVPSLVPPLQAAVSSYTDFHFAEAVTQLDELVRLIDARAGGDLDGRQLAAAFLYRGLSRLELGQAETAWEDLVRAARLDPTRVLDPARFAPRVLGAWHRAVGEVAQLPRTELEVLAPPDAVVRIDGHPTAARSTVIAGPHFVAVEVEGFEPWAQVVAVAGAHERIEATLRAWRPPDGDQLLAWARESGAGQVLLGALERSGSGWRFVARLITVSDGKTVSDEAVLGAAPLSSTIAALLSRLLPQNVTAATRPPPRAHKQPWWVWALVGGAAAAAVAIAVPLGVIYSGSTPSASGHISW